MTTKKNKSQTELIIHYEHASYFRLYPANGAFGGVTPQGDFAIEFYVERNKPPSKTVHSLNGQQVGQELRREPAHNFVRELQVGVVLSQSEALALAKFINEKIEEYAKQVALAGDSKGDAK